MSLADNSCTSSMNTISLQVYRSKTRLPRLLSNTVPRKSKSKITVTLDKASVSLTPNGKLKCARPIEISYELFSVTLATQ